jgi:hypothetical protein
MGLLAAVATCSIPATAASAAGEAASPRLGAPQFLGSLAAQDDTKTLSWGRDGGVSVPLPNGQDLWLFADTPRWQYQGGGWKLTGFIRGSSAGMVKFTQGKRFTSRFSEVIVGKKLSIKNKAHQFMANPKLYLPDGSGRLCNKAFGGSNAEAVRWPTGAALMPDKKNVLVPFIDVCVIDAFHYSVQGWGFALYNWRTNTFSVKPFDVFKPKKNGAGIPLTHMYGSPVVVGKSITMYTYTMAPLWVEYSTTIPASATALKNITRYNQQQMSMPATFIYTVAARSKFVSRFTLFMSTNTAGGYKILTSASPRGPWTQRTAGTLPKCATSPWQCTSFAIHPEVSSAHKLMVTYYLPGSGPTIAGHPGSAKRPNFAHVVWAGIPI